MHLRRSIQVILALTVVAAFGCGPSSSKGVHVKGIVLLNGQPLAIENGPPMEDGAFEVSLYAHGKEEIPAATATDGSFECLTPLAESGKYKLVVLFPDPAQGDGSDSLGGKFDMDKSPISVDIPEDQRGKTLDLGTFELSKYMEAESN